MPFLSAKQTGQVDLRCVGARLPFSKGIAQDSDIIGVRSEASQLLTSGTVDMLRQTINLHGALRAHYGITQGVSNFASEIRIEGPISAPQVGLDKAGAPGALARVAAAFFTGGASMIGTAIWDGAQSVTNPSQRHLPRARSRRA